MKVLTQNSLTSIKQLVEYWTNCNSRVYCQWLIVMGNQPDADIKLETKFTISSTHLVISRPKSNASADFRFLGEVTGVTGTGDSVTPGWRRSETSRSSVLLAGRRGDWDEDPSPLEWSTSRLSPVIIPGKTNSLKITNQCLILPLKNIIDYMHLMLTIKVHIHVIRDFPGLEENH